MSTILEHSPIDSLPGKVCAAFNQALLRILLRAGANHVSFATVVVLLEIGRQPGQSMRQVATKVDPESNCPSASMTLRTDVLEDLGWVERRPCPDDRRSLRLYLTELGDTVLRAALDQATPPPPFRNPKNQDNEDQD